MTTVLAAIESNSDAPDSSVHGIIGIVTVSALICCTLPMLTFSSRSICSGYTV